MQGHRLIPSARLPRPTAPLTRSGELLNGFSTSMAGQARPPTRSSDRPEPCWSADARRNVEDRLQMGFYGGAFRGPFFALRHDPVCTTLRRESGDRAVTRYGYRGGGDAGQEGRRWRVCSCFGCFCCLVVL